ncbi:MAG: NAD(P)H-binding protein [Phycisphaerales bacterium]|nr:NAD(P)H-binding protein [Phycisphaerales bacterium]
MPDQPALKPVLVLGATGGFGGAMAAEILSRGWPARFLVRDPHKAMSRFGQRSTAEIVRGDVQESEGLLRAAEGCRAIVHAVNYPYPQWKPAMEAATANVIAAGREHGSLVLFPGNVYSLGKQPGVPLDERAEPLPCSAKGRLRAMLENMLKDASGQRARSGQGPGGMSSIVLRAGDYFGPTVRNGLVDRIFGAARLGRTIRVLGPLSAGHEWAFVPDVARAAADLLELATSEVSRNLFKPFEVFHFPGHWWPSQSEFGRAVWTASGHTGEGWVKTTPWWLIRAMGMFDPMLRELTELRYLWDAPLRLEGGKLRRFLPGFSPTDPERALAATAASYPTR